MKKDKRLTWKRSLDGHEDVGLRDGVTVGDAICKLADLEERETVEVVHGRWRKQRNERKCSVCKFIYCSNHDEFNYCPNCGAKMDGDRNA